VIVLDVESMDGPVERRTFEGPKVTVGASAGNDIQVARRHRPGVHHAAQANCSRRHGTLELRDGKLVLHDMGTSNGWHVLNEDLVAPHRYKDGYALAVGDRYYVGDTKITIVSFDGTP
jgi:hypothetical protein